MLRAFMSLFLLALLCSLLILFRDFLRLLVRQLCSPLRNLPGPPSPSFFMGNLEQMHDMENTNLIQNWVNSYGNTFVYRGFIGGCRLMTTDPLAIAHILGNAYHYPKPDFIRDSLASMAAGHDGLLTVEGDVHKRQRKILSPAFSTSHIKSLTPIFWDKATELRDIWLAQVDSPSDDPGGRETSITRIDVLVWLGRATLDVIGLAGFGYAFNALTDDSNELARAFGVIFSTARKFRVMTILQVWFPFLRRFRRNNATMEQAQATMRRIGLDLIEEKRSAVLFERGVQQVPVPVPARTCEGDEDEEKGHWPDRPQTQSQSVKDLQVRDILSVLIRSNLSSDPSQQMSEEEVLCQISTFLAAGHETTSSALTWCLYALAKDPAVQDKLRAALRAVEAESNAQHDTSDTDTDSHDEDGGENRSRSRSRRKGENGDLTERVARCTYLDWVVRESLRVHAPVTNTMRVCMRDQDEIPVRSAVAIPSVNGGGGVGADGAYASGVHGVHGAGRGDEEKDLSKSSTTTNATAPRGHDNVRTSIPVRKWDIISVPIQAINKSELFWGEDARVFRPERWAAPPQDARAIPGLYANTLTFLNGNPLGGNRACIGYKFALIEIKIFLYVLVKDLEFSIDPSMVIEKKVNVVTRPFVKSEPHLGNQMPLNISRASPSASVLNPEAQLASTPTISPPPTLYSNK